MNQTEGKGFIPPEVFDLWEHWAETSEGFADAWRDYARMIAAFQAALERAPCTVEACEDIDIESLLISELEHLADTVNAIFPRGGMMEFATYLTGTTNGHPNKTRNGGEQEHSPNEAVAEAEENIPLST
jgi:hypothetical protein